MAGNYIDAPANRFAWDTDGATLYVYKQLLGTATQDTTNLDDANDEDAANVSLVGGNKLTTNIFAVILFPEARDLAGINVGLEAGTAGAEVTTSTDTTNGIDGTWTTQVASFTGYASVHGGDPKTFMRQDTQTFTANGVLGVRIRLPGGSSAWLQWAHIYGTFSAAADRLRFSKVGSDAILGGADLDWGNVPRSSSADKTFRIKNQSATLTANSIVVTSETLTDTSPTVAGQLTFSTDGTTFTSSINIGNLAPGALSGTLYVRRVTPSTAVLGLWWARATATAGSWT